MGQLAIRFATLQQQFQMAIRLSAILANWVRCCSRNFRHSRIGQHEYWIYGCRTDWTLLSMLLRLM